jgi:hypothetical protein
MIEKTIAQGDFEKLLIDNLSWHAMATWAKRTEEFALLV